MRRLKRKFLEFIGYKYYVSCRTHLGYMSAGPFTLKQAKQEYRDCKSWNYKDVEIVHCSRVLY